MFVSSRVPVPFSRIAGHVIGYDDGAESEALEKRFDRDRADLRELGVNVEYAQETAEMPAGYFVRKDAVFQRKVEITHEEAMLLSVAARVGAAATGGGALFDALKSALRKLAVDVPLVDSAADRDPVTVLRVDAGDPKSRAVIAGIAQAIARERRLRFRYQGIRDESARPRIVSPYGLGLFRGAWYLAGFDHDRREIRVFKVARIAGAVEPDPGPARKEDRVPSDFKMEDHLPKEQHELGPSAPSAVVLRIVGPPGRVALSSGLAPKVLSDDGTTSVVAIEVRRPLGLVPWILSSGGDVTVVRPASLRSAVAKAAAALLRPNGKDRGR